MTRDARWEPVWATTRRWKGHPGWLQFYVDLGPDISYWTALHSDDIAMDPAVFGGMWTQVVRDVDEQLE